jgi:hypothetical protein
MNYHFKRTGEGGLLIIPITIDGKYELQMLLDTGASHTTIDSNALYINNYDLKNKLGTAEIETANGIIPVDLFEVKALSALGITRKEFPIQVYDFISHGIFSNYEGVLGLDFFENTEFCINLKENTITVSE